MLRNALLACILVVLIFLSGWFGRTIVTDFSLRGEAGARSMEQPSSVDQISMSRSQALRMGGAKTSPTPNAVLSAQNVDEILAAYPLDVLRRAYYAKSDEIQASSIDKRYPRVPEKDEKVYRQDLYSKIEPELTEDNFWMGQSEIVIAGKLQPFTLTFNFYDGRTSFDDERRPVSPSDRLCYLAEIYYPHLAKDRRSTGISSCLSDIRLRRERFSILMELNIPGVEEHFTNLAVEVPVLNPGNAHIEFLTNGTRKWVNAASFTWHRMTRDEKYRIEEEIRSRADSP
jgi:hypothetical protein